MWFDKFVWSLLHSQITTPGNEPDHPQRYRLPPLGPTNSKGSSYLMQNDYSTTDGTTYSTTFEGGCLNSPDLLNRHCETLSKNKSDTFTFICGSFGQIIHFMDKIFFMYWKVKKKVDLFYL